ncbi:MAG: DUF4382 domain-containing protein [Balneolaceae bacterium]|nr:MAG: DUF4382 domain-containing protein [Balneolaceae bacterium]
MRILQFLLIAALSTLVLVSCSDNTSGDANLGTMRVVLTDAPGNYEAVFIDIQAVRIHRSSNADDGESGWIDIPTDPVIVDLLELTNGKFEILGEVDLEPGRYSQLRLILGNNNEVVIDGETHALSTPSAQQSGLKLQINADIEGGEMYTLLLDFDASRSIVRAGNSGRYNLKPVIRTVRLEQSGAIEGTIEPAGIQPWVYAIADGDTLAGTRAEANGDFLMIGLLPGSYQVSVVPINGVNSMAVISNVEVSSADTTKIGTVSLE